MNLNHLRYFVAVAQKRNFTRAAEQNFVTQPAISRQIAELEQKAGTALIDRSGRQISLTLAGEEFYRYAQQTLDLVHSMKTRLANITEGRTGLLRISAVPSSIPELTSCLFLFAQKYPDIQVKVDVGSGMEQLDCMNHATHDLYFSFYTHVRCQKTLECIPTSENRFALLVHKSDAPRVDLSDFRSLSDRPMVMEYHATGPFLVDKILKLCLARGRGPENILACSSYLSVTLMVNANLGFAILPMNMARSCYADHIEVFPIPGDDAVNLNAIGWHTPLQSNTVKNFLEVARQVLPEDKAEEAHKK